MAAPNSSILDENLFFLASALSRSLSAEADTTFATVGLSSSHALILLLVSQKPEIQPSSLADELHLNPSTITRLVEKLERRHLVERNSMGRATSIVCTNQGEEMAIGIKEKWEQLLEQKRRELGDRYVDVLSEMIANALGTISKK